ncbi:Aldehyde/histidinol dehydrogenase [Stachybotrys elegans]|uniref:Aldehyde dehydrogenase n=1 Tax=Stachybotrys elegans TaxID=80388 RepID=A0A8K0WUV8_9HYPO|nr:Aldehyde/histidinol dehydrogenase [Stachybotrys elegans]
MASNNDTIPAFAPTAVDEIPVLVDTARSTFRTGRTKDIQYRLVQLRKLYWGIVDNTHLMEEALMKDLGKCAYEANISEIDWCKKECIDLIDNLETWAKDDKVVGVPLHFRIMNYRIRHEPLGVVLAIGAYNYPFQLLLVTVAGAMAAGNCVIAKPSESSPHSAMVIDKIFREYLDPDCFACVNGMVPASQRLLDCKFDKIAFIGGNKTGTIIAKKAAETLTPVLLELGGCNPAFVTRNANIKLAARRILFMKSMNAGQICLSHNYVLVERSVLSPLIAALNEQLRTFMPKGTKASPDYARIVNKVQFDRIKKMLDSTRGRIVLGGKMDESQLFMEPTAVLVEDIDDPVVVEETFGPLFSIIAWDRLDDAINIANKIDPTPLALFAFGSDEENKKILDNVTSGGATCNDSFLHSQINAAPMGGVGSSGMGNYHGYYSFKAFSHQRTVCNVPYWADRLLNVRYMPYSMPELRRFQRMSHKRPNFDRNGKVIKGLGYWIRVVLGLGGKSATGSLMRWVVVFAAAAFAGVQQGYISR